MDNSCKENLIKILKSNSLFLKSIKKSKSLYLDNYIRVQLMILYLRLNNAYLIEVKNSKINKIIKLLENPTYIINEDTITFSEESITFQELENITDSIIQEVQKRKQNKTKLVNLSDVHVYIPEPKSDSKCIYFNAYEFSKKRDLANRRLLSEEHIINSETIKYSQDIEYRFVSTLNYLITSILKNDLSEVDYTEILFLYSIMNLLTVSDYIGSIIPLEAVEYDQNLLSISSLKYEDPEILHFEKKVLAIELNCKKLESKKQFLFKYCPNSKKYIEEIDKKIDELCQELTVQYLELYELRSDPTNFPQYLLSNIKNCFAEKHIELQNFPNDPFVTFFSINRNSLNCFFEMHLSSFVNFINNEALIQILTSEPHIKRFVSNIS